MDLMKFVDALSSAGYIDSSVAFALVESKTDPISVVSAVVSHVDLDEELLYKMLARASGVLFGDMQIVLESSVLEKLSSEELFKRSFVVPFGVRETQLLVAMINPFDIDLISSLQSSLGYEITPVMVTPKAMFSIATALYGTAIANEFNMSISRSVESKSGERAAVEQHLVSMVELSSEMPSISELLRTVIERGASDLHLTVGAKPTIRIDGKLVRLDDKPILGAQSLRDLIYSILTDGQRDRFEADRELDASYGVAGIGRFRVNVFLQRGSIGSVMRSIPTNLASLDQLGLPPIVSTFAEIPRGLILVTGPTGSGKSTTLAALIDKINSTRDCHIVTVEDPIEFLHSHKAALINQREVGEDTHGFAEALRHVLRQDPDVILVGELRDHETISMALTAAETGHAVYASLHTQDAPQSIDRIIDVFPAHQQSQIRAQLASSLRGVVTQQLLPKASGKGRVAAVEVLVATPAVRNLIREAKIHQIYSSMQAGAAFGMQTMESSLAQLVRSRLVSIENAIKSSSNPDELKRLVSSPVTGHVRRA